MEVWNGIERYPTSSRPAVATIGNYDGVHLGHVEILRRVIADARRLRAPSLVITFDPHPLAVVAPERQPPLVLTRRQKIDRLRQSGVARLLILEFTPAVAALAGEAFFDEVLGPHVPLAALWVGRNFRFGHDRRGDLELLGSIGARRGFTVEGVDPVIVGDETVSSSAVRQAVAAGDVDRAWRLLGRPFAIEGEVEHGEGRGRRLQCPTANIAVENELIPRRGVYVTETVALAARFPSVTNVGVRPTFGGEQLTVETHLLDFEGDLYDERVEVRFLSALREEQRFRDVQELADQLARDRAAAEGYFQNQRLEV